jgi:hypothetical protein
MARPEGQTSNSLLDTLAEWNLCLQQECTTLSAIKRYECHPGSILS